MFHSDYKYIINRLPKNLIKRVCQRFLHYSKDLIPLESISEKSEWIEFYLKHTLEVYKNLLNKKYRIIVQKKIMHPQSWLECNIFPISPYIYIIDSKI